MPTTIPYDPSLELANVVPMETLSILEQIAAKQAPINAAEEALNSAIFNVRSLNMTRNEMANMGIDTSALDKSETAAKANVQSAAGEVVKQRLANWPAINSLRSKLVGVTSSIESPVDYNRTSIKQMPLSADSLKMDAQYFSFDSMSQDSSSVVESIKSFVSESTSFLGDKQSMEATDAAQRQVNHQLENHNIAGTLLITASCTHKNAAVLAPFYIDVDKGIRVWNTLFPDNMIKTNSPTDIAKIALQQQTKQAKSFNIISGATYGSSFIGMVHILRQENTQSSQDMVSVAASLQEQFEASAWFAHVSGGFGVDSQFADSARELLSSQQISSHISLISIGSIPSITANDMAIGVKEFAKFDPAEMMGKLATLANATSAAQSSVQEGAQAARTGENMVQLRSSEITSVMSSLASTDDGSNKILDINSLMTAFEDYVNKAIEGNVGAPINYYLKPITASQLAQMWIAKYLPGKYVTSAGDDSTPAEPSSSSSSSSGNAAA